MAKQTSSGGTLAIELTDSEAASWRERGQEAARFRVAIKRAARACELASECSSCVVYDQAGEPLESVTLRP